MIVGGWGLGFFEIEMVRKFFAKRVGMFSI